MLSQAKVKIKTGSVCHAEGHTFYLKDEATNKS